MTTTQAIHTFIRGSRVAGTAVLSATLLLGAHAVQAADETPSISSTAKTFKSDATNAIHTTEHAASDSWITAKVKAEILANSVSKAFKVGVKTTHGDVALSGKLPSQDAIDLVKMIAEKVKGVKNVNASALEIGS